LLPNYAFPEQGVLLQSIIIRDNKRGETDEQRILTFEYERPGASAITELVPDSVFYAEGRKVTIEQVDVDRDKPAKWRFCRSCSYCEPERELQDRAACPRCADTMWADAGRVQTMLRLSRVYARTFDSNSRIGDDSDDRERKFFVRQALLDVPPESVRQAWAVVNDAFPFAFEFLERVQFREVNFGQQTGEGEPIQIAGNAALSSGDGDKKRRGKTTRFTARSAGRRRRRLRSAYSYTASSIARASECIFRSPALEALRRVSIPSSRRCRWASSADSEAPSTT
ncbi:MAG: hypothetical protein ABI831_28165, partial [Betaproteobacteria bacterium]